MGGKGSGRPPEGSLVKAANETLAQYRAVVRDHLVAQAENLGRLLAAELELAMSDEVDERISQKSRHFLIDLLTKKVELADPEDPNNPVNKMMEKWTYEREVKGGSSKPDLERQPDGPVVEVGHTVIP